jgi:hypothetical protein
MSADLFSEFHEYPEMTSAQKSVLQSIGLALFGVQGTEAKLKFLITYIFPKDIDATLKVLHGSDEKQKKKTLGILIENLKQQGDVSEEFQELLSSFLNMRNRFVHGLFLERGYSLGSDEGIKKVEDFIQDLEQKMWFIDSILMGYIVAFSKSFGVIQKDSITERNRHKYFTPEIKFKKK